MYVWMDGCVNLILYLEIGSYFADPIPTFQGTQVFCRPKIVNHYSSVKASSFLYLSTPISCSKTFLLLTVSFCDPMGDTNLVSQLFPRTPYINANGSTVMVTARMDVAGMFDQVAPGAMATVTGLVTLLTTAHLLSRLMPQRKDSYSELANT